MFRSRLIVGLAAALVLASASVASATSCPAATKATMELAAAFKARNDAEVLLRQVVAGTNTSVSKAEAERRLALARQIHQDKIAAANTALRSCTT